MKRDQALTNPPVGDFAGAGQEKRELAAEEREIEVAVTIYPLYQLWSLRIYGFKLLVPSGLQ